ncbi:hypothetical protein OS493_001931 [Desmophyllum pertusum]|uniref:Uncharacterized protein n=1 Tax=Desmophyllum pertusum TaxID=174260 RepID=A0A9W9Z786_9CNID|nr:hypothetical protein OS493_001931 [Desmophyllum pertusum]
MIYAVHGFKLLEGRRYPKVPVCVRSILLLIASKTVLDSRLSYWDHLHGSESLSLTPFPLSFFIDQPDRIDFIVLDAPEKRQRQETLDALLQRNPGPSKLQKDEPLHDEAVIEEEIDFPEISGPIMHEVATQTEWPGTSTTENTETSTQRKVYTVTCDAECQFPLDVVKTALSDHTYVTQTVREIVHAPTPITDNPVPDSNESAEDGYDSQGSQVDLFQI